MDNKEREEKNSTNRNINSYPIATKDGKTVVAEVNGKGQAGVPNREDPENDIPVVVIPEGKSAALNEEPPKAVNPAKEREEEEQNR